MALDGAMVELSLVELLAQAEKLRAVSGATPGETVAVIEHLLALCYASETYPSSVEEWQTWVEEDHSLDRAASWLADEPDENWDLFHPTQPLGQNILLAPFLDEHGTGPAQLVVERSGDYSQFFDHHHLEHPEPFLPADAFRAMLTQHVYGLPARARISGKATLGPAITNLSAGRLSGRIRVLALGTTLGETLRLNLYPPNGPKGTLNLSWTTGDMARRGFQARPPGREVSGPADLHSYLGRSVLLRPTIGPDGTTVHVDRVLIGAGELLTLEMRHLQDAVFARTMGGTVKPLWPSASRALWLKAHALYAAVTERQAGLYGLLGELPRRPGPHSLKLWAVGLVANKTLPISWTEGFFPFAPHMDHELHEASRRGSAIAEHVARSLQIAAYAAWEVAYPNPRPSDRDRQVARFDARAEHWPAAAGPFQILLEETAEGEPVPDSLLDYADTLQAAAIQFLTKRLDSLPRNNQGLRARAVALRRLKDELTGRRAPAELRGV
ncbi:type I-E CRISPR-associated protein Cse1/CasA [Streptomyces paludis]|uniref:type I-E CRISPR-associated protein Cse1/CasA n=1 Tax=Streptomyces paludis TaxID=2282738 RepID=UPI001E393D47|nr:type I-E CRISPR-associated protein Cse1/CasA [Streptomyces paludis]